MSTPPTRPRFNPRNRESTGSGGFVSFVMKTAWLAAVVFGIYYLMNMRRDGAAPVPVAQGPPPPASGPPANAVQAVPSPAPSSPATSPAASPSSENLQNVELTTAASIQRQQLTAAKFKQRQAVALFEEVMRAIDEWERELSAWEKRDIVNCR